MQRNSIYIGFDPREADAYLVTKTSIQKHLTQPVPIHAIQLGAMRDQGFYERPTEIREGRLWDVISGAPMSTEFAISRFLTPLLAKDGLALFMDCDMLVRTNLVRLFDSIDRTKAVTCVKHHHVPKNLGKMDGQVQTFYKRKNWSSFMVFNCDHEANKRLNVEIINSVPGRDLHSFCWLNDDEIGELDASWNWLVGYSDTDIEPKVVHFTEGVPTMEGHEHDAYADEWRNVLKRAAA